jgi:thioredoxin reductase (NADPH)
LAAAVQLKRYGLEPCVFEAETPGGLLWSANLVENYPGFPGGVPGRELARLVAVHAVSAGVDVTPELVVELAWEDGHFRAATTAGACRAPFAIVASGTKPRELADFYIPSGVRDKILYDVRSIVDVHDARIVIVGAGDAAFDYALNLGRRNAVVLLNRGESIRCLPLLYERAAVCARISYRATAAVAALGVATDGSVAVECVGPDGRFTINADYLIGAIGREPRLDFVSEDVEERIADLERRGVLYFAGDVKNGMCRQTAIAVGDGVLAAMRIGRAVKGWDENG